MTASVYLCQAQAEQQQPDLLLDVMDGVDAESKVQYLDQP